MHRFLLLSLTLLVATGAFAASVTAPAKNWVLPLFTKEGFRWMTARGTEARATGDSQLEVVDLNLTTFTGDAAMRVESIILSPSATFLPDEKRAFGHQFVRFIRDEVEASGQHWTYHHGEKNERKISLTGNVRITFQAELKDILQ